MRYALLGRTLWENRHNHGACSRIRGLNYTPLTIKLIV